MRSFVFIAAISVPAFLIPAHAQITKSSVLSDGLYNTAAGIDALSTEYSDEKSSSGCVTSESCGSANTAVGYEALVNNTTGSDNTALGMFTLEFNTTGGANTASGLAALSANISGSDNTASGYEALNANKTGNSNSAYGVGALESNTTGSLNVAYGLEALSKATTANYNTAIGADALQNGTTGNYNTASGFEALYSDTSGDSNIAVGYKAGYYVWKGSNNIDIGNSGKVADTGVIRVGSTQTAIYLAGATTGLSSGDIAQLSVDMSTGQIGVAPISSARFKTAIEPMGETTGKLEELRPVTFQYKSDPHGARQYGLVAEEVAKVYPELVVRDGKGQILSVRYDELAPMLLNVVQMQQQELEAQDRRAAAQAAQIDRLESAVLALQASQRPN